MCRMIFPFLIILLYFCRSSFCAVLASATVSAVLGSNEQPGPTPTPRVLEARDDRFCGYYFGDAARPFTCQSDYRCAADNTNSALGCVTTGAGGTAAKPVLTTCLDYNAFTNGLCQSIGPKTGCCQDAKYPFCGKYSYTGSPLGGYTILKCLSDTNSVSILAWAATTSGPSSYTSESTKTSATTTSTPEPESESTGLSSSDKITLGTSIGIGVPAAIAGIIAAWYACRARYY